MLSRRAFVGKLAVGAAAVGAVTSIASRARGAALDVAAQGVHAPTGESPAAAAGVAPADAASIEAAATAHAAPPWELLAPLAAGATVSAGWRVSDLSDVHAGSCVVTLASASGRSQRVHLCRNDGAPAGVVYTDRFDMLVMNGGAGDLATDEGLAQAVAALAHVVARNERQYSDGRVLDELLPHGERVQRYASSAYLR